MSRFFMLRSGKIIWSSNIDEWLHEHEKPDECILCGAKIALKSDYIFNFSSHDLCCDENRVCICERCSGKMAHKKLYEWNYNEHGNGIPQRAEGRYLKLLYGLHEHAGTLDATENDLGNILCPECSLKRLCGNTGNTGKMTVFCLEGIFS
ncbi:hypothetical protein J2128_002202 [Methanomicrobium sp. W14]|uniref:HNH endonuclease n=1 Tax=Methanomicrobium sp. W14 TaxID=2817839 RepID=UPI001FD8E1C9|nr:HNH endonuclease [Methanomicrobium sp. W14]MBP2134236.1 hypothetical protein [Methanomicrobium sp. W14]